MFLKSEFNTYKDTGKPHWFDPEIKEGVSDHFPIVAEIILTRSDYFLQPPLSKILK